VAENITGGAPSVLISRAVAEKGDFTNYVAANMRMCVEQDICNKNELYLSLTGNKGSPQPNGTAISSGYRTALLHYPHYENGGTSFESAKKIQAWGPKYVQLSPWQPALHPNRHACRTKAGSRNQTLVVDPLPCLTRNAP
jgi:hypothetical protein